MRSCSIFYLSPHERNSCYSGTSTICSKHWANCNITALRNPCRGSYQGSFSILEIPKGGKMEIFDCKGGNASSWYLEHRRNYIATFQFKCSRGAQNHQEGQFPPPPPPLKKTLGPCSRGHSAQLGYTRLGITYPASHFMVKEGSHHCLVMRVE